MVKPVPEMVTPETVTLLLPVFFTVSDCEVELPTASLPKLRLEEERDRVRVDEPPAPDRATFRGVLSAELLKVSAPVKVPDVVGANATETVVVAPAERVLGMEIPEELKPAPLTVAEEMVRLAAVVFLSWMVWEFFTPMATVPKFTLEGVEVSFEVETPDPLTP
jgi:hypothetical protein